MRRISAFFVLVIVAAISIGCSKYEQGSAVNTNATGTTTYSNTSAPPSTTGSATNAAPRATQSNSNTPGETKIKPPTDK